MKYNMLPVLLTTTFLSTPAMAITLEPTLEDGVISYSEGKETDYNFTVQEADANGNLTTKYYKIDIDESKLSTSSSISWTEVDETKKDESNVVAVQLPNNQTKYFKYTYTTPSGYSTTSTRVNNTLSTSDVTDVVFSGISSSSNGGAIYNYDKDNSSISIKADFIDNYSSNGYGGAIYNYRGTIGDITGDFIGNYATSSDSNFRGGAIFNYNGTIGDITGDFIGNYVSTTGKYAYGGAIYNYASGSSSTATIGDITGDFIGNYASTTGNYSYAYAGAIYNYANTSNATTIIGNITGDFIGNYVSTTGNYSSAYGGAIYNYDYNSSLLATIGDIEGDFIGNYATSSSLTAYGGAIHNAGIIGNITGDFIGNYASGSSSVSGGAIYNYASSSSSILTIGDITGDFIGNYATSSGSGAKGGAIFNDTSSIGNITCDFIGNYATSSGGYVYGGAIYNGINATISDITGDFIGNYATSSDGYGGAIYNYRGTIGNITGDFIGNYATSSGGNGSGGAIYNSGSIGDITGDFIGNYATSSGSDVKGGAIYSKNNITLSAKSNGSSVIKDNYVEDENGKRAEAIYMDSSRAILTLKANNKGTIEVYDIINGVDGYDVKLTGDGTGSISIFNDIHNADVIAENVEVNLSNGAVKDYTFKTLTVGDATSWNIDVNLTDKNADNITSSGSNGTVYINKINNIGSTNEDIVIQVLKNTDKSNNLQLALNEDNITVVEDGRNIGNEVYVSQNYIQEAGISLATTDTTNDSIKIYQDAIYNALVLINDKETSEERSFIFDESDTQTLNENLSATTAGILNIKGFNNDAESSIIDASGHSLFDLSNATTLNIEGVTLSNALGDAITVSEQAELNLTNVLFENNDGNAITSYGNVNINVKDTDIAMSENISMNGDNPNIIGLSFNVENGALNLSNEISGSDYNMYLKGGNVNVSGSISGVNNLEMSPSAILGLGTSGRISTNNMMHAQDTTDISLQSSTSPTLQIDVDVANNRMSNGIIDVSGDVSGTYGVIVNALSTEYAETPSIFLSALQDDATTSSEFSVLRVKGSPYMWKTVLNAEGETTGSTWYLAMEKPVEPDTPGEDDTDTPDNDNINAVSAPEVIAGAGLHTAGIEQTRSVVRNVSGKVANAHSYCPNCGIMSDAWDGKQLHNAWVLAQGENANIDKPVDMEAKIWGVEGGFDLQSDMNNTFGVFASYRNGEYDLSGKGTRYRSNIGSEIEIDSYLAGLYYRYDKNMNWAFATVYGGTQEAEANTDDGIANFETDGLEFGASAEIGHSFVLNNTTTLSPSLGIYYTQINYDAADDNVGKEYKWEDIKHLEAELGLSLSKNFENGKAYIKPSVIQTLTADDEVSITGLNEIDTYHDQTLGRIEIGGNYGFNDNWSAYGWANYTFGSDYEATSLGAGLNYAW